MRKFSRGLILVFFICITCSSRPQAPREQFRYLPNRYYHVVYSDCLRVPVLVTWTLPGKVLRYPMERKTKNFRVDKRTIPHQSSSKYYLLQQYDRGHMCPSADRSFSASAQKETFLMSNIAPQAPSLNRGGWLQAEVFCRASAIAFDSVKIACGPIFYSDSIRFLSTGHVAIPDAFWKVVLTASSDSLIAAWIFPNIDSLMSEKDYRTNIDSINKYGYIWQHLEELETTTH